MNRYGSEAVVAQSSGRSSDVTWCVVTTEKSGERVWRFRVQLDR